MTNKQYTDYDVKYYDRVDDVFRSIFDIIKYEANTPELILNIQVLLGNELDRMGCECDWISGFHFDVSFRKLNEPNKCVFVTRLYDMVDGVERESEILMIISGSKIEVMRVK